MKGEKRRGSFFSVSKRCPFAEKKRPTVVSALLMVIATIENMCRVVMTRALRLAAC